MDLSRFWLLGALDEIAGGAFAVEADCGGAIGGGMDREEWAIGEDVGVGEAVEMDPGEAGGVADERGGQFRRAGEDGRSLGAIPEDDGGRTVLVRGEEGITRARLRGEEGREGFGLAVSVRQADVEAIRGGGDGGAGGGGHDFDLEAREVGDGLGRWASSVEVARRPAPDSGGAGRGPPEGVALLGREMPRGEEDIELGLRAAREDIIEEILAKWRATPVEVFPHGVYEGSGGPWDGSGTDGEPHGALVQDRRDLRAERGRVFQEVGLDVLEANHLLPEDGVVEPAGGTEVHPPSAEVAGGLVGEVAAEEFDGLGLRIGIVGDPVEAGLDLYFRQCSILVTCRDLAVLGATLANRGTNPITGERALAPDHVDDVLSVMTTCGMYDYAGQWLHEVGLPAKSGVAGGIVAVLPGRLGIGVFSPRLDTLGNSVRGIAVCRELSDRFRLHLFDAPRAGRATLRNQSTLARRQSTRVRPDADVARLRDAGAATHVLELQGDLGFAAMETIHRRAWAIAPKAETLVFDISRIDSADETAAEFFGALVSRLTTAGKRVAVAGLPPKNPLCRHLVSRCEPTAIYPALDAALEACEESILTGRPLSAAHPAPDGAIPLSGLEMAQGLDARSLAKLEGYLRQERFAAGQRLFAKGDEAQQIYFLSEGTVSVRLYTGPSTFQRLATFSAGSVFGEMAVVDRGRRSSDVWAETNVTSFTLSTKDYDRLGEEQPHIKFRLLEYLIRILSSRLRKANEQIAALSG